MEEKYKNKEIEIYFLFNKFRNSNIDFLPNWGNIGDMLIHASTLQLFNDFNITHSIINNKSDCRNRVLFAGGGGNLVDLYNTMLYSLSEIVNMYDKIYVLPHTVYGEKILKFLTNYGRDIVVFCREYDSFRFLNSNSEYPENIYICKDLAFNYNYKKYIKNGNGVLNAFRYDLESTNIFIPADNIDLSTQIIVNNKLFPFNYWTLSNWTEYLDIFLKIIAMYKTINTNRLHVAIAASMLGKNVKLYSNSYFKNRAVYEYSLFNLSNVIWID